jgi:hypothetical protein
MSAGSLLYLLQAPRVLIVITSDEPGVHEGHCPELGLRCRGSSPVQVLRLLTRVMEERVPSGPSSIM